MRLRIAQPITLLLLAAMLVGMGVPAHAQSRNASFVNPNSVSQKSSDGKGGTSNANTVVADPAAIDAGETLVNVARRITVFFYNGFRGPVQINDLTLNADGNVRSKVVADDCKTIKTLPVQDKCSVALEITPSSPGPWSVELLLNHTGIGRITRAEVNGTTLGKADEKSEGLAISKKIAAPLDFGAVAVNEEKAARTMLIENDSTTPLLISSIDLIASEGEGLTVRNNGCKESQELKPGESCPITVMWEPVARGNIATDLIVRHSGNLGFVVVPIRGSGSVAGEGKDKDEQIADSKGGKPSKRSSNTASLMPRSTGSSSGDELQIRSALPPMDALPLPKRNASMDGSDGANPKSSKQGSLSRQPAKMVDESKPEVSQEAVEAPQVILIGTVGGRAILGDANDQTYMVGLGEKVAIDGMDVELLQLDPTRAVVMVAGQRTNLSLRNMQTIAHKSDDGGGHDKSSNDRPRKKKRNRDSDSDDSSNNNSKQESNNGSNDGSGTAPPPSTNSTIIKPTVPLDSGGLNSKSSAVQMNNAMTAQDVINMMK